MAHGRVGSEGGEGEAKRSKGEGGEETRSQDKTESREETMK